MHRINNKIPMKHKTLTDMYLDLKKQTPARMKSIEEKVKLVKKIAHVVITDSGKPQDPIIIQSRDLLCSWEEYQEELAIYGIKMHISWDDLKDALALFGIYAKMGQLFYKGKMLTIV